MKLTQIAAILIALSLAPFCAQAAQSSDSGNTAQAQQPTVNVDEFDKQMAQAQENLKKMQEQMIKIHQTTDPKERQKLLQEHQVMMQSAMGMMNSMWGGGMMGHNMMKGGMMGSGHMMGWKDMGNTYSNMTPEQMKQRQYMMDQYMGMQQMMMDQMMQHQMGMQPR
jgi:hypothetical protein